MTYFITTVYFSSNLLSAMEEVGTITTHDDNLEKQYRESKQPL